MSLKKQRKTREGATTVRVNLEAGGNCLFRKDDASRRQNWCGHDVAEPMLRQLGLSVALLSCVSNNGRYNI